MSGATEALAPSRWLLLGAGLVLGWHATAGPHLFDSGELVAAGALLGGSHPPGQPLHALLAHAASLLPLGPVAWRVALVSAAAAAGAAWLVGRITGELLDALGARRTPAVRLAPSAAALATLLAPPVLRQATRVEVYGVALALTAAAILALIRWASARSGGARWLYGGALCAGLTVSVHPPHAVVPVVLGILLAATLRRDVLRRPRVIGAAALACVVGLALTSYLPVRAGAGAPMWGEPTRLAGLWDYVSGAAYRQNLGSPGSVGKHLLSGMRHSALAAGALPLLGVAVLAARVRRSRAVAAALLAAPAALACAWVIHIDPRIPDASAYAGPAAAVLVATGCAGLAGALSDRTGPALTAAGGLALALAIAHPTTVTRAPEALRQDAPVLETLGGALVDTPPPRSLVMVRNDFQAATWMMGRAVDGARPDVALFVPGLATSSWHWRSLAPHPLYDGQPVRGRGRDTRAVYVDGAFRTAAGSVAVAIGPTPIRGPGTVAGPYRILWPRGPDDHPDVWDRSVGERLAASIGREAARGPGGDHDAVAAVVRQHQSSRARRLAGRGRVSDALVELSRAAWTVPADERRLMAAPAGRLERRPPPTVDTPGAFLVTAQEAERTAAVLLWAAGETARSRALLEAQAGRGEAEAVLQLAWLRLRDGDRDGAREAARAAVASDPALREQARALTRALEGGGS